MRSYKFDYKPWPQICILLLDPVSSSVKPWYHKPFIIKLSNYVKGSNKVYHTKKHRNGGLVEWMARR